jgi:transposase
LNQIEEVSIDLWKPYQSVVEKLLPNAKVVADRFYVMKQVNEELDSRRKAEKKQAEKLKNKQERATKIEGIKHSKYPLLKKKETLNEKEKEKLEDVGKVAPELKQMYQLKEELRDLFDRKITADEACWRLLEWLESAYKNFPKSCQTIRRWFEPILGYFDHRTTQGVVEGINPKIKLIKRRAFGLNNFDHFRRRVLLHWSFCY